MTVSKFGVLIAMAALLAAAAVCQAQQAQNAPQAASKATADAPAAKAAADTQAADSGLPIEMLREARDDGYKPVTRGKVTLYCKSEIIVGSAFPIRTCYDSERLKIVLQQDQEQRMQLRQMHSSGTEGH